MTQAQLAADLGNDAVFYAAAASVFFVTVYAVLAKGWRSDVGRSLLTLDAGLTLALGPSVLHRLFGLSLASIAFSWYFAASIALVGTATWWRGWLVVKVQAGAIGLTPRQFGWHLLRGTGLAVRDAPGRVRRALRERREEVAADPPPAEEACDGTP